MSIVAKNVEKVLGTPPNKILSDISLEIKDGEFVSLTGRSGSGKSTLLYLLSSLDDITRGLIEVDGKSYSDFTKEEIFRFRNEKIGFVFQFHYLISELTAIENVLLPARKLKKDSERESFAKELFEQFGLKGKEDRLPRNLSGGEQQRVAIARSLIMEPKYIFADEPTGSLDSANGQIVMDIIRQTHKRGATVIMVTHDVEFAKTAQRQIELVDGRVVSTKN